MNTILEIMQLFGFVLLNAMKNEENLGKMQFVGFFLRTRKDSSIGKREQAR
jgi:hypothetical protein